MRSFALLVLVSGLVTTAGGCVGDAPIAQERLDGGAAARCDAAVECARPPEGCSWVGGDRCTTCGALVCVDGSVTCEAPIECPMPPLGCHMEGADGCTTCGTLVCPPDAGCETPVACSDPPEGCSWAGGDFCTTCGTLVCEDVLDPDCRGDEWRFPEHSRACGSDGDCVVVEHQIDCCGRLRALGIAASERERFDIAEASCRGQVEVCWCPLPHTIADDDSTSERTTTARVECIEGQCRSTFLAEATACEPGCAATEYCDLCATTSQCTTRPPNSGRFCTLEYRPVCGCDGRTYSNLCVLGSAGIAPLHGGACGALGPTEPACTPGGTDCGEGFACCYPCGVEGCEYQCEPTCTPGTPGCEGGCILRP